MHPREEHREAVQRACPHRSRRLNSTGRYADKHLMHETKSKPHAAMKISGPFLALMMGATFACGQSVPATPAPDPFLPKAAPETPQTPEASTPSQPSGPSAPSTSSAAAAAPSKPTAPTAAPSAAATTSDDRKMNRRKGKQFGRLDANNDSFVELEEFKKGRFAQKNLTRAEKRFGRLDKNGDKKLSKDEWLAAPKRGKKGKNG